jgi:hypothetical protein
VTVNTGIQEYLDDIRLLFLSIYHMGFIVSQLGHCFYYTIGDFKITLLLGLLHPERLNKNTAGCHVKLPDVTARPAKLKNRAPA